MSEIDEIFASKGKKKSLDECVAPSAPPPPTSRKKKKKASNNKTTAVDNTQPDPSSNSKKRPLPETVVDRSSEVVHAKRSKADKAAKSHSKTKPSRPPNEDEDEARFKDSRGTGPRRTTEEGWPVYHEDELGIRDDGGGTALCPFDCDCCF